MGRSSFVIEKNIQILIIDVQRRRKTQRAPDRMQLCCCCCCCCCVPCRARQSAIGLHWGLNREERKRARAGAGARHPGISAIILDGDCAHTARRSSQHPGLYHIKSKVKDLEHQHHYHLFQFPSSKHQYRFLFITVSWNTK